MFDPFSITGVEYDANQFINNLQAYNGSRGTDEMLDLIREIQASGSYFWQGLAIPASNQVDVDAQETIDGSMQVPMGTYITSIQYYSELEAGFVCKIYDKGSRSSIFYGDFQLVNPIASNMLTNGIYSEAPSDTGSNDDTPFGPAYLLSPFIINNPGVLGWELTNKGIETNTMQMMLACAVPINAGSAGIRIIEKG